MGSGFSDVTLVFSINYPTILFRMWWPRSYRTRGRAFETPDIVELDYPGGPLAASTRQRLQQNPTVQQIVEIAIDALTIPPILQMSFLPRKADGARPERADARAAV